MAPAYAVPRLLARNGMTLQDFDFVEIHEAFAATVLDDPRPRGRTRTFCRDRLGLDAPLGAIDRDRLNVNGSSLAAGHPFAATGGRIVATLAKLLHEKGSGPRADLDLRRRRPGRRGDPRGGLTMTRHLQRPRQQQVGKQLASRLGLPQPVRCAGMCRASPSSPGPVLVAGLGDAPLAARAADLLRGDAIDIIPVVAEGNGSVRWSST